MELNPFLTPFFNKSGSLNDEWWVFFQKLWKGLFNEDILAVITTPSVSGTNDTVDEFAVGKGNAVFYLYFAKSVSSLRAGILIDCWDDDGVLPSDHAERDTPDVGDTSDLTFAFAYDSDAGTISLLSTSTLAYRIMALRVLF